MRCRSQLTALLAVGLIGLAACGRQADSTTQAGAAKPISSGKATGQITVWAMGDEGEKLGQLAQGFERENPGVSIKITPVPWDGAHDKLSSAIAAQQTPDMSLIGTTWMGEFAKDGAFDPTPPGFDQAAFFPSAWNSTVVNRTSFGVPWYSDTRSLYYRTDLAAQAGVQPPKSWDELMAFAKALKDKAGAVQGINLQAGGTGTWQTFLPLFWEAGGDVLSKDGKFTLDSPAMVKALGFYSSFFKEGVSDTTTQTSDVEAKFVNGQVGAFVSGPFDRSNIEKVASPDFKNKYAVAELPPGQSPSGFAGGGDLAVFKTAKNRDGAWKFIQYLSQPDVQANWFEVVGDVPAVKQAWQNPQLTSDKSLQVFGDQLSVAKAPPAIPTWEQIASVIDTEVEQVNKNGEDPAQAAKNMQAKATAIGTGS